MIKILITRPENCAKDIIELAKEMGFEPISFPLLQISALKNINLKREISEYNWILFTSSNAVKFFMKYYSENKLNFPQKLKVAAIGPGTERTLLNFGFKSDFVPISFNSTSFGKQVPVCNNETILYATLLDGPTRVESALSLRGFKVDRLNVYRSDPILYSAEKWNKVFQKNPNVILFYSPRTVRAFFASQPKSLNLESFKIAALGNSIEEELKNFGISAHITSNLPTTKNLLKNIKEYYE